MNSHIKTIEGDKNLITEININLKKYHCDKCKYFIKVDIPNSFCMKASCKLGMNIINGMNGECK